MLGCDIIEISRVKNATEKYGDKFIDRILTDKEKDIYINRKMSNQYLAGRFAAKEAISKAFGTGIGEKIGFLDIEILPDDLGAPKVTIKGEKDINIELSISHSNDYAMAVCIKVQK